MVENITPDSGGGYVLNTGVGRPLLDLFDRLTTVGPWRRASRVYPVISLEAAGEGVDAGAYIDALMSVAVNARIPHIAPKLDRNAEDAELRLLDEMSAPKEWRSVHRTFGKFRFPRSELIRSLEAAVANAREKSRNAADEWDEASGSAFASRRRPPAPFWLSTIVVIAAALLGGVAQGVADKASLAILLVGGGILLLGLLVAGLMTRRFWVPTLSRVGFGTPYRWFATSSFFAVLGGEGFHGRRQRVFDRLDADDADQFRLQMKTFAFLEDLRAGYRRLSPSLRGFKRPGPPVVFLNGVTQRNGGVELLSAMSDIRSRRSELHPLLVIAAVDYGHSSELTELAQRDDDAGISIQDRYDLWEASLGTAQAPSEMRGLPWVLRLPLPKERRPGITPHRALRPRRRPRWTWLWSTRSLILALLLVCFGTPYLHHHLATEYCKVDVPFSANVDTFRRRDAGHAVECVGVATRGVRFEPGPMSMGIDGRRARPRFLGAGADLANSGGHFTLADLQSRIEAENARVLASPLPHVTVLYAGMLTTSSPDSPSAVSSIRELAGAYLAQIANNKHEPGARGGPLQVRLLPVNDGENMAFSGDVTTRVLDIARRDRTVVGVVGMGRNTDESRKAIKRISDAGLAVLDTVNSSDQMPALAHYYGLASTDSDEAVYAARAMRMQFGGHDDVRTMIVSPRTSATTGQDYSTEIAGDVAAELPSKSVVSVGYDPDELTANVQDACDRQPARDPYRVVFFAGRAEDLRDLVGALNTGGCRGRLTLIGGDEFSRAVFGPGRLDVHLPKGVTVFYPTFTYLPNLLHPAPGQDPPAVLALSRDELGIGGGTQSLLGDGQLVVTYDATTALVQAAQRAYDTLGAGGARTGRLPGSSMVTSGGVLLELPHLMFPGATGTIDFRSDHPRGQPRNWPANRGLTLLKVTADDGTHPVCGRMTGKTPAGDLPPCD